MPLPLLTYAASFTNAFLIGASIPLALYSTDTFKDLKISVSKLRTSGDAAWLMAALLCGLVFGIGGLLLEMVKRRNRAFEA